MDAARIAARDRRQEATMTNAAHKTIDAQLGRAIRQHALLRDVASLGVECDRLIEEDSLERLSPILDERTRLLAVVAELSGQIVSHADLRAATPELRNELEAIDRLVESIERDDAARFERMHARRDRCARELKEIVAAGRAAAAYGRTEASTARSEDRSA
jgi:hypothetical protein